MAETLGQDFKRKREERGVSLKDVADATRVGVRFLQAIEADDFTALPGGVYTRSFIRTYAKYLGMDEEEIVARYQKQFVTEEPTEPMMSYKDYPTESSQISLWIGLLVLLGLIGGGTYGILRYFDQKNANQTANLTNKNTPNLVSPNPTATPSPETTPSPEATPSPGLTPGATPSPGLTPGATPTPTLQEVVLTLKTKGEAWVSIRADEEANSQMLTIPANSSRDFKATSKMKVTIGNLPAVQIQINGQPAKLPSTNGLVVNGALITKENFLEYVAAANAQASATPAPNTKRLGASSTPKPNLTTAGVSNPNATPKPKKTPLAATPNPNASPTIKPKPKTTPTTTNPSTTTATPKPKTTPNGLTPKPKTTPNVTGTTTATGTPRPKPATPKPSSTATPKPNSTGTPKPKITTPKPSNTAQPN